MARPVSRRRREEEEEEPEGRGRRRGPQKPAGPNMTVIMGSVVGALVLVLVVVMAMKDKPKPKPAPVPLGKVEEAPPPKPLAPGEEPPKPLTEAEKAEVDQAFRDAEPHMATFRVHYKKGFDLKEAGDNEGANDEWLKAKKAYRAALGIVNEVMEDEERFPQRRQEAFMRSWTEKLSEWSHAAADTPKTFEK
jgi:hypothetical protein